MARNFDKFRNLNNNIEVLRDMGKLMPYDRLSNAEGRWQWYIDGLDRLHLRETEYDHATTQNIPGVLDIEFQGDGVTVFRLLDATTLEEKARELYDDHCLDGGLKFRQLLNEMSLKSKACARKYKVMFGLAEPKERPLRKFKPVAADAATEKAEASE